MSSPPSDISPSSTEARSVLLPSSAPAGALPSPSSSAASISTVYDRFGGASSFGLTESSDVLSLSSRRGPEFGPVDRCERSTREDEGVEVRVPSGPSR